MDNPIISNLREVPLFLSLAYRISLMTCVAWVDHWNTQTDSEEESEKVRKEEERMARRARSNTDRCERKQARREYTHQNDARESVFSNEFSLRDLIVQAYYAKRLVKMLVYEEMKDQELTKPLMNLMNYKLLYMVHL
jgi:hypothetical protein